MSRRIVIVAAVILLVTGKGWSSDKPAKSGGSKALRQVLDPFEQGRPKPDRIVGGHDTTIDKNPWQVALLAAKIPDNNRAQFCGGSVIAPRWVLTAAHCVDNGTQPTQVEVLVGTASLTRGGRRIGVADIVVNKLWNPASHDFDIALLNTSSDLATQAIAGLGASSSDPVEGDLIAVTCWGTTTWGGAGKTTLQEVDVPYVSRDTCNQPASYNRAITTN